MEVEANGDRLTARYRPERAAALAGAGCAVFLFGLTAAGLVEAVQQPSAGALLGLPCSALFALAFAVLGLTRGASTVDRARRLVINERYFLGICIRRDVLPYGVPRRVVIDTLGQDRRPFSLVSVLGDGRQAEVVTDYDARSARAFAERLGEHLGVPVEEHVADPPAHAPVLTLPQTPEA